MRFFKKMFEKENEKIIAPMPSWETIVEVMLGKQLDAFSDEVVKVVYSKNKAKRYVVLKNENNPFASVTAYFT